MDEFAQNEAPPAAVGAAPELTTTNSVFRAVDVEVDGRRFVKCTFDEGAVLVYSGGNLPAFVDCTFGEVTLQFADAAADTLRYLNGLQIGGFAQAVNKIFDGVRQGTLLKSL